MYKLSNYLQLTVENEDNKEVEYFAVVTKNKSKYFLVNEAIYLFLKHFEVPCKLQSVIDKYSKDLKLKSKSDLIKLENQLLSFFNELKKRKWIVKEDALEPPFNIITQLRVGDTILNYTIKFIIANKKATDLYLVTDGITRKPFVVKLLNRNKFNNEQSFDKAKNYFKMEYNFLAKFNSIYINKTYAIKEYDKQTFIVLEHIKGVSLNKFVNQINLKSQDKLKLVLKILQGFSAIHQAEVYHGDIHLSNVLVKQNLRPKIIDFGYSNEVNNTNKKHIRNGGVYAFIPPERALRSLDHRFTKVIQFQSEVYQIGLLLYYIYVRDLPFKAETWKTMVDEKKAFNIRLHEPFLNRRMPKGVRNFIIKSLEQEPKSRFANATQMYKEWKNINRKG